MLEVTKNAVLVGTGTDAVRLGEVKAFGKKQMAAADWARGVRLDPDATRFGDGRSRLVTGQPPDDVDEICLAPARDRARHLVGRPSRRGKVPQGDKGKGFVLYRMPHKTAVDPETGEMYDDLLVIITPTEDEKQALVEDERSPFFTIDHFRGFNAVLVQQSRLGELDRDELAEIITDAWAARAPKKLVKAYLAERDSQRDDDG